MAKLGPGDSRLPPAQVHRWTDREIRFKDTGRDGLSFAAADVLPRLSRSRLLGSPGSGFCLSPRSVLGGRGPFPALALEVIVCFENARGAWRTERDTGCGKRGTGSVAHLRKPSALRITLTPLGAPKIPAGKRSQGV